MDDQKMQGEPRRRLTGIKAALKWMWAGLQEIFQPLQPRKRLDWAVVVGMAVVVLLAALFEAREAGSGLGAWVDFAAAVIGGLLAYGTVLVVGLIAMRAVRWGLERTPPLVLVSLAAGAAAQIWVWGDNYWVNLGLAGALVFSILCLSIGVFLLSARRDRGEGRLRTALAVLVLAAGLGGIAGLGWLFLSPGEAALALPGALQPGPLGLAAANPADPGPYQVGTLSYGSGTDRHRPAYADQADLITDPVNASSYVYFSGWQEEIREWYWGFGMGAVPLNARVWYPVGEGPFPLVLVVHGNHNMTDFSESGYEYLGELLASRGFIVASVDENFFNGSFYGKARSETDARAWLLLKHLEVWAGWNSQPGSIFYRQVDLERIALIGHSRGGEAVGLAAAFNRLPHYPENGHIRWNFNFSVKSVIAIAPVDQQYKPGGRPAELVDVNYLVIQGSHDGDVSSFKGIQQYERVSFTSPTDEYFKAAVYIYRANHGQFNSGWGNQDRRGVLGALLNKAAFLTAGEQRQIGEVYISAFLEATLNGREEYRPLFQDYHLAGDWLPETNYLSQYQDGGYRIAADFEEDADLTTAALPGGSTLAVAFNTWKERALRFRSNDLRQNHVVRISWGNPNAYFGVSLPDGTAQTWGLDGGDALVFLVADERDPFDLTGLLDFGVLLLDERGQTASVRLSEILQVSPQMPARFTKIDTWDREIYENATEVVFQSVRIPLSVFVADNPGFSPDLIREIRFVFDQTPSGTVSFDEIGFDLEN